MEYQAIYIGLDLNYFWSLNPNQFNKHLKAYVDKQENDTKNQMKTTDQLNYYLGYYVAIGVNNGDKYPKKPLLSEKSDVDVNNDEELEAKALGWALALGAEIEEVGGEY